MDACQKDVFSDGANASSDAECLSLLADAYLNLEKTLDKMPVRVDFSYLPVFQAVSALVMPVLPFEHPICLLAKHNTNHYDLSAIPPVNEQFCREASVVFSTQLDVLLEELVHLVGAEFNQALAQFVSMDDVAVEVELASGCLIVAISNNCSDIQLQVADDTQQYPVVLDNLSRHVYVYGPGRLQFKPYKGSNSLYVFYPSAKNSILACTKNPDKCQTAAASAAETTHLKQYLRRQSDETAEPKSELIAIASLKRKGAELDGHWQRIKRIRYAVGSEITLDEETEDECASLNEALLGKADIVAAETCSPEGKAQDPEASEYDDADSVLEDLLPSNFYFSISYPMFLLTTLPSAAANYSSAYFFNATSPTAAASSSRLFHKTLLVSEHFIVPNIF